MASISSKEKITIRSGVYPRIGAGIQFVIEGNIFFSNEITTKTGKSKKVLFTRFTDKNSKHRTTSISGLKPIAGSAEEAYYFDTNNPKTRASIDCEASFYKLRVDKETIKIEVDE